MREGKLAAQHEKHAWIIDGVRYEYITVPKDTFELGVEKIWIPWVGDDGFYSVNITDKERTVLDLFIHPKLFGGMGEALGILENS